MTLFQYGTFVIEETMPVEIQIPTDVGRTMQGSDVWNTVFLILLSLDFIHISPIVSDKSFSFCASSSSFPSRHHTSRTTKSLATVNMYVNPFRFRQISVSKSGFINYPSSPLSSHVPGGVVVERGLLRASNCGARTPDLAGDSNQRTCDFDFGRLVWFLVLEDSVKKQNRCSSTRSLSIDGDWINPDSRVEHELIGFSRDTPDSSHFGVLFFDVHGLGLDFSSFKQVQWAFRRSPVEFWHFDRDI
jgi:hypothetical protein